MTDNIGTKTITDITVNCKEKRRLGYAQQGYFLKRMAHLDTNPYDPGMVRDVLVLENRELAKPLVFFRRPLNFELKHQ